MSKTSEDYATAEDITGEVFLRLQLKWEDITPHLSGVITAWLYTTAEYLSMDHNKKRIGRKTFSLDPSQHDPGDGGREVARINSDYDYQLLLQRIEKLLSKKEWALFVAIYVEELPQHIIMERFHIPNDQQFYLRKSRLRAKLKQHRLYLSDREG